MRDRWEVRLLNLCQLLETEIIGRPKYLNYSGMDVLSGIKQGVINKIREWQLNNIALEVTYIVDFHSSNYYSLLQYNETKDCGRSP